MLKNSVLLGLLCLLSTSLLAQNETYMGAIVRGDVQQKKLSLVFTGHEFADGGEIILQTLKKNKVKGSFFFTGDFYRTYPDLVKKLVKHKNYLGAHSDQHLLYCSWEKRDSTLVTKEEFVNDLKANYAEMRKLGVKKAPYYLPSYEWHNSTISQWANEMDIQLVNITHGTLSHADYTTPSMKNYRSSEVILKSIYDREASQGLQGYILLIHIGTDPERTDKLYNHLDEIIQYLKQRDYKLVTIDKLVK